mmetsp:Transcript_17721/g.32181  ORF Transcript_17721/g.32181 Transcript_17721/m.32181 type:complete len:574 (+) Transcript_17721:103-1824(+)
MARKNRPRTRARTRPLLPVIHEVESNSSMDDDNGHNISQSERVAMISGDDMMVSPPKSATSFPCMNGSIGRARKTRFQYVVIAALFVGVFLRPYHYLRKSLASNIALKPPPPVSISSAKKKQHVLESQDTRPDTHNQISTYHYLRKSLASNTSAKRKHRVRHEAQSNNHNQLSTHNSSNESIPSAQQEQQTLSRISDAPLFYHISPGSTGSRTLYHAACTSGFPSVHHKSFCISQTRGIQGVADNVVQGVLSHYELLRLYEMAYDCCSLWSKGKIRTAHENRISHGNTNNTSSIVVQQLCNTPLHEWTRDIQSHLTNVLQSGLVGLFDTPYPYLAPQVLELAKLGRTTSPIIAMTERDPKGWASSRSRNHGILVCREEYSYEGLGASEFDVVGCVTRAYNSSLVVDGEDSNEFQSESLTVLHFWDVFQYRSHKGDIDPAFQMGMERQMERHQGLYLPMSQYAPDIFGVQSSSAKNQSKPIEEKDVANDIRNHILDGKQTKRDVNNEDNNIEKLQTKWRDIYTKSLTCRGRVNWERKNDTLIEYYRIPKTCEVSSEAGKTMDNLDVPMIPLIPV